MPTPPQLTPAQRSAALAKSTAARQVRAAIKARVKAGELSLSAILTLAVNDEAIAKMRVAELLESFAGVGKVRALAILEKLNISPTRRIQGLGVSQRENLLKEFPDRVAAAQRGKLLVLSGPGESERALLQRFYASPESSGLASPQLQELLATTK
jgi:guanylate kinase